MKFEGQDRPRRRLSFEPKPSSPSSLVLSPNSPQGPIIGNRRLVNDTVARVHAQVQSWKRLHVQGLQVLKRVIEIRDEHDKEPEPVYEAGCQELADLVKQMNGVLTSLHVHSGRLDALVQLLDNSTSGALDIPFLTWSYLDFADFSAEILRTLLQETEVRTKILAKLKDGSKDELIYFGVAWSQLIYASSTFDVKYEAFLVESGLRN